MMMDPNGGFGGMAASRAVVVGWLQHENGITWEGRRIVYVVGIRVGEIIKGGSYVRRGGGVLGEEI